MAEPNDTVVNGLAPEDGDYLASLPNGPPGRNSYLTTLGEVFLALLFW